MKTDRLFAITIYLLNHGVVSASALAERFEVSKRTIQRDIEALSQAGIPVTAAYGAEGGYHIMDGFKLSKGIAGADDYANIITALKGLSTAYHNDKVNATLEKAVAAMSGAQQRVFVDFAVARESGGVNEHLNTIEQAIYAETPLLIEYTNAEGIASARTVEPLALTFQWYAWYLFAYCTEKRDYRLFKLARVSCCEPVEGAFTNVHGDVERLMKHSAASDTRRVYHVRLLCHRNIRQQALEYLKGTIVEERAYGDFVMALNVPLERMWFSLLMSFGDKVRVLEPAELRDMLAEKAREILSVHESNHFT